MPRKWMKPVTDINSYVTPRLFFLDLFGGRHVAAVYSPTAQGDEAGTRCLIWQGHKKR